MADQIQLRRDTAANWSSANPTLAQGEPGLEIDTGKLKYGDGTTAWNSLPYFGGSSHGPWRKVGTAGEPTFDDSYWSDSPMGIYFREAPGGIDFHAKLSSNGVSASEGLTNLTYLGDHFPGMTGYGNLPASIYDGYNKYAWLPTSIYVSEWMDLGAVIPEEVQFSSSLVLVFSGFLPLRAAP